MQPERHNESPKIISPFANTEAAVSQVAPRQTNMGLWIGLVVVLIAAGVGVGLMVTNYLNDPFRTLEPFSISKYLESATALLGSRFKAEIRVEANLGWKENVGNLMLFSTTDDSRPIAVMVPAEVSRNITFTKGQTYLAELEVKEGGLIYANKVRKN